MRFSRLCQMARITISMIWNSFFYRLPRVTLYELTKFVLGSEGKPSSALIKVGEGFDRLFGYGPRINHSLALGIAPDGTKFYCPISEADFNLVKEIYHDNVYDKFFSPGDGDIVVDVGANIGIYTIKAARNVGERGMIISVEPHPYTDKLLATNVRMNNLSRNVVAINIALSDFSGRTKFYLSSDSRRHSLEPIRGKWVEIEVKKLDAIMEELNLKHCDILKIDVEGHELQVLKGAKHILETTSKVVVAAYHFKGEEQAVKKLLTSRGFRKVFSKEWCVFSKESYVYALKKP